MTTKEPRLTLVGELVAATFEAASKHTEDQQLAARVATQVVLSRLRKSRRGGATPEKVRSNEGAVTRGGLSP